MATRFMLKFEKKKKTGNITRARQIHTPNVYFNECNLRPRRWPKGSPGRQFFSVTRAVPRVFVPACVS